MKLQLTDIKFMERRDPITVFLPLEELPHDGVSFGIEAIRKEDFSERMKIPPLAIPGAIFRRISKTMPNTCISVVPSENDSLIIDIFTKQKAKAEETVAKVIEELNHSKFPIIKMNMNPLKFEFDMFRFRHGISNLIKSCFENKGYYSIDLDFPTFVSSIEGCGFALENPNIIWDEDGNTPVSSSVQFSRPSISKRSNGIRVMASIKHLTAKPLIDQIPDGILKKLDGQCHKIQLGMIPCSVLPKLTRASALSISNEIPEGMEEYWELRYGIKIGETQYIVQVSFNQDEESILDYPIQCVLNWNPFLETPRRKYRDIIDEYKESISREIKGTASNAFRLLFGSQNSS